MIVFVDASELFCDESAAPHPVKKCMHEIDNNIENAKEIVFFAMNIPHQNDRSCYINNFKTIKRIDKVLFFKCYRL